MAARAQTDRRGLSAPMRALAYAALACGCALIALKAAGAVAQPIALPTIQPSDGVPPETLDASPRLRRAPPLDETARGIPAAANPTRKPVRRVAPGPAAVYRLQPAPLRRTGAPTLAAAPLPILRRPPPEADPYSQVGLSEGGFVFRPAFEVEGGYDSNPNRLRGAARGSAFVKPGGELRVDSDWTAHSFSALLRGSYSYYTTEDSANRPELEARANWRFDATRDAQINVETRFKLDSQSPQTTNLPFVTSGRPLVYQYGATLGGEQRFNRLSVGLRGLIDRYAYEDARLPDGTIVDQGDRTYNQYATALRFGYELTPGFRPFVEGRADRRIHDREIDVAGYARDSTGLGLRAGTTIEIARTLTGEIAVGYERRRYADARLADLHGLVGDASLIWSATPLTTIGLRAQTSLDETTSPGVPGAITRKITGEIAHAFRRNLVLTASGAFQRSDYQGSGLVEDTMTAALKLDYKLSRTVAVRAGYAWERLKSTAAGADYTANIFSVGLRLQR
jgi:hypothetical protein